MASHAATKEFHEEQELGKVYDAALMRRLLAYLTPYKGKVAVGLVLLIASSLIGLLGPFLVKIGIDDYIAVGRIDGLWIIALIYAAGLVAHFFIQYTQVMILQRVAQGAMYDLRCDIFTRLQGLPVRYFDRNPVGRLVTRVVGDVDVLNDMFAAGVVTIIGDVLTLLGIIVVLLLLDWQLALITFTVLPVMFAGMMLFKLKAREAFRKIRTRIAKINSFMQEQISGMTVVQSFTQEERSSRKFDGANHEHMEANIQAVFYYSIFWPAVNIVLSAATALILWYGGAQIISATLTFGILVAFLQYAERFFRPIADLSEKYNVLQQAMASSERIFKLLDTEPEPELALMEMVPLTKVKGGIEFRNVWFAYDGDEFVLKDLSFSVEPGQKVAIVGATGAGKSSIINVLTRLYPIQKGQILLDGAEIARLPLCRLRREIGVVQQEVFIFSGSISDNISLDDAEISEERIHDAARLVNAAPFIEKYPDGYGTFATERGNIFSVGQKQLLSFARALAFNPGILVLDEATANIDTETEILIQEGLQRLIAGRTSLVIAHRLSTIKEVDKILVMHRGRLVEEGSHEELLAKRGIYYKLYQLQYREQETPAD
ncbi:MAG TPA: ABC transporter ATP-binding protein [Acidobacteriota bacterium]|nr:ABC transporter ATP-binding protein [Acidobacteriota bacterium]